MVNRVKLAAGLEAANSKEFEQSLAQIALKYLEGKASELLPYLVGFQLLKKTEDNSHAIGVFGFKVNDEWVYAPIFWLQGELKGNELMFIAAQNQFVPMDDGWVGYILARQNPVLGQGTNVSLSQLGSATPDFSRARDTIFSTPAVGKFSSVKPWAREFVVKAASALKEFSEDKTVEDSYKNGFKVSSLSLKGFLQDHLHQCKVAFDRYINNPVIEHAVDSIHGVNFFENILKGWAKKQAEEKKEPESKTKLNTQLTSPKSFKDLASDYKYSVETSERDGDKVKLKKVEVIVSSPNARKNYFSYSNSQRSDLVRQGYTVMDSRKDDEVSLRYMTGDADLRNPCHSGVYEVVRENGDLVKCLVILRDDTEGTPRYITRFPSDSPLNRTPGETDTAGNKRTPVLVFTLDGKKEQWIGNSDDIWVVKTPAECFTKLDKQEDLKTVSSLSDTAYNHYYAVIAPNGKAFGPFTVGEKQNDETYDIYIKAVGDAYGPDINYKTIKKPNHLVIGRKNSGKKFFYNRDFVYAPEDSVIVDLGEIDYDGWDTFHPADVNDIFYMRGALGGTEFSKIGSLASRKELNTFKIFADNRADIVYLDDFHQNKGLTKMAALIKLIEDPLFNFREDEARNIIKEAAAEGLNSNVLRVYYKRAAIAPLPTYEPADPGDVFREPQFEDPVYTTDPSVDNFKVKHPVYQTEKAEDHSMLGSKEHMEDIGPAPDPLAYQMAGQAAEEGDDFGFDTSMIAALVKETSDDDDLLTKYTSTFMKALDRAGRLLFFYYSKYDQLKERLGALTADVEQSTQNTFNNLGELTLILKRTDVGPAPNLVDVSPEMAEEEVSENDT